MYEYEVPVIMELLPVYSLKDLIARSEGKNNKGIEAAQAAAEIIQFYRTL
jgi:6,7-dimethyl-8-ribityllumazine synthase